MADAHGSVLVAVRGALVDALKALPDLSRCQVEYQWPNTLDFEDGLIYTRDARANHSAASLRAGRTARKEVGTFDVAVAAVTVDDTQRAVSTAAMNLALIVESFVADHRMNELNVDGLQTLEVDGDVELEERWKDGGGFLAEVTVPIKYTARLV